MTYVPTPGTKTALAIKALRDGLRTTRLNADQVQQLWRLLRGMQA